MTREAFWSGIGESGGGAWRGSRLRWEGGLLQLDVPADSILGRKGDRLADSEALAWLERLTVRGGSDEAVGGLVKSPVLHRAAALVLSSQGLGPKAAGVLARTEALAGL